MNLTKNCLLISLTSLFLLSLLACGSEKIIIKKFPTNHDSNSTLSINARALVIDFSKSEPLDHTSTTNSIDKVTITITGENISLPIVYDLFEISGKWSGIIGNIPEGPAFVNAKAYDIDENLIYESVSQVTVVNGQTLDLSLVLEPTTIPSDYHVKAPLIKQINISSLKIAPNEVIKLEVLTENPDSNDTLNYKWGPKDTGQFTNINSAQTLWTAPSDEGTYQLSITITDDEYLVDHETITVEVNNKYGNGNIIIELGSNNFPIITSIIAVPTSIDKGESTQVTVNAYDPDGDKLTYAWSSSCDGTFSKTNSSVTTFTVSTDVEYGPCTLEVEVSDNTLTYTGMIDINITDGPIINLAPEILTMFQSTDNVSPHGYVFLIIRAKDAEGTSLTFDWTATTGTFENKVVLLDGDVFECRTNWVAPETSNGPITITVEVTDEDGLKTTKSYLPIQLIQ